MKRILFAWATAFLALTPPFALADEPTPTPDPGIAEPGLRQRVDPDEQIGQGKISIGQGHVDLGPRIIDGQWTLLARDDTAKLQGGEALWRNLDDVVFKVHDAAKLTLPDGDDYAFTGAHGGDEVWAVPQTEAPGVLWLGWNTQDPEVVRNTERGVTLRILEAKHLDGDGTMTLFLQPGNFAPPQVLFDGTQPGDIWVDLGTHTHANWVFTKPGTYLVRVRVNATGTDQTEQSAEATLRFSVGDQADDQAAFDATGPWEDTAQGETTPAARGNASTNSPPAAAAASATSSGPSAAQQVGDTENNDTDSLGILPWTLGAAVIVVGGGVALGTRRRKQMEQEVFDDAW